MPAKYEAIRDHYIRKGLATAAAKTKAAKIFNATRGPRTAPVTGPDRPMANHPRFNDDLPRND